MLLSEMPSLLKLVLGFNASYAGILCMPPYAALMISTLSFGFAFQDLQTHYHWKVESVRRTAQTIALLGSSVCMMVVVFCDIVPVAYAFLIISQVCFSFV